MKLSQRISLFSTVFLFIALLMVNTTIYFLFQHYTTNAELSRAVSRAHTIVEAIQPTGREEDNPQATIQGYVPGEGMIRIIQGQRTLVSVTKNIPLTNMPVEYSNEDESFKVNFQGTNYAVARTPMIWPDGSIVTVEVNEPMTIYDETLGILRLILFVASLFIIIPSYFAGRSLSRFILQPISALVKTMNEIRDRGQFKKIDVNDSSQDELSQMGHSFNHMIELLQENFEKQQQFVSDASHELKTPLTVIESYARLLKRWGMRKPEVLEEAVEAIYSESLRMKEMTNQMLALAHGEATETTLHLTYVDLGTLTKETAQRLETTFQHPIHIHMESEELHFQADEAKIKQLLFILLENGLKYSETPLDLYLSDNEENVEIKVQDYGMGIPKEDLPKIFERFFRVDKARSRKTGGTGLGLSIAKAIVDAHEGSIKVESQENHGTTFSVFLPKKQRQLEAGG